VLIVGEEKRFFPPELWDIIGSSPAIVSTDAIDEDGRPAKQRKLGLVRKSVMDRLAKFDEGADEANAGSEDEDDDVNGEDEEGEDFGRDPGDDVFEEDEWDEGDDYNAELYFDAGDEDFEEGGGEDYGDEG
jgi:DNA-directed RNA polymerase III subunit RPC7